MRRNIIGGFLPIRLCNASASFIAHQENDLRYINIIKLNDSTLPVATEPLDLTPEDT